MNERLEDSGGSRKMKKFEKPQQIANNREYLDMDTDEEEFGRQETPEPEEESEIEPDKPIFTEEELNSLVQYVKNFTTLSCLEESNWTPDVIEIIEEYFCNPANTVLTIFHESKRLRSCLKFPERTERGLTYFLRSHWQIYTPENFLTTVIFGSVDDGIENSTLKFVENMYAPIAFHSDDWPAVMRNEVFSNLHEFLMCLTDATYNPMGLTILYVPREGLESEKTCSPVNNEKSTSMNDAEKTNFDTVDNEAEGLIERLERVARYWIRQIREALNGICNIAKSSSRKTIVDEILYWHYRYENLSCVYHQLTNDSVISIVQKLERERSASVKQYEPLLTQVRCMLNEATSNITYLNLLEGFEKGFDIPDGIEEYATRIFLLVRFIVTESLFYRGEEKMEKLLRAFATQTVEHLQRYTDLNIIFDGNPVDGRKMILECIDCCEKIENIYDHLVEMDRLSESTVIFLTNGRKVFNNVDTFVQRCRDLIFIADSRMTFDKFGSSIAICGPRGIELDKRYRNIEEHFQAILYEIKNSRDDILDIVSTKWHDRIVKYKDEMKNVENMVKNWINDVFEDILNVEEAIEALHVIKRFARRTNLRDTLNDRWKQIWKIFDRELENCCSILTNKDSKLLHHPSLPPYSGNASIIRSNKIYLTRQYKMLIDASDWYDDCDAQNVITKKYKNVLAAMNRKEDALFMDWQKYLMDNKINPESVTNESILKYRDNKKFPTINVNLEMYYLDNIREITEWSILNYETKNIFSKNCPKWQILKTRYNKVQTMCKFYNSIFEASSKFENLLFSMLLDELEDTMSSGFEKVTWTSESFERFFTDCMEVMIKVQESFDAYRSINSKIDHIMKQIAITSLVNCEKSLIEMVEDTKVRLEQDRLRGATKVVKKCKTILKLLLELKSKINTDEPQIADYWNHYIDNMYEKLKYNFTSCTHLSLISALEFLRGDFLSDESVVKICVDWTTIKGIENEMARINASSFMEGFPVEEFTRVFETRDGLRVFIDCIDRDDKTINLRAQIDEFFNPIHSTLVHL